MANTLIAYQEIRIDVRHPELTEVYVYIENLSRDGFPVEGWHHKTFPASMSSMQIFQAWADGKEDPVMWPFKAPPSFIERLDELKPHQENDPGKEKDVIVVIVTEPIKDKLEYCSNYLRKENKPYPRTCQFCGLGQCRFE